MRKFLRQLDTLPFWTAVFAFAVLVVGSYAYSNNQAAADRNRELIMRQQLQLSFLCETIAILDRLNLQETRINREALRDPDLAPLHPYLQQRNTILTIGHLELSEARGCGEVE